MFSPDQIKLISKTDWLYHWRLFDPHAITFQYLEQPERDLNVTTASPCKLVLNEEGC